MHGALRRRIRFLTGSSLGYVSAPGLEFLVDEVLPLVKAEVAAKLSQGGYSQVKIARVLGLTQPMVNKLLAQVEAYRARADKLGLRGFIEDVSSIVVDMVRLGNVEEASGYLTRMLVEELAGLRLCNAHRLIKPDLPKDCSICARIFTSRDSVLANVAQAVRMLEGAEEVSLLVPGVLMNIAEAIPNPVDINDVAAIPGRIDRVGGRVKAWNAPSYGASLHLASILINIIKAGAGDRAVASVRWGDDVEKALIKLGWSYVKVGGSGRPTEEDIVKRVSEAYIASRPRAVADMGGYGIEPITYIFGRDAVDVALHVIRLAREVAGKG